MTDHSDPHDCPGTGCGCVGLLLMLLFFICLGVMDWPSVTEQALRMSDPLKAAHRFSALRP